MTISSSSQPASGFFQLVDWKAKAVVALVVAVVAGTIGVALYGDASGAKVTLLPVSLDAFYSIRSLERFIAGLVLTLSAIAWAIFLTIVCTVVALDTIATWRGQDAVALTEEFETGDADTTDV